MIKLLGKISCITGIAVSGGPDSMAALDFVFRNRPETTAFYFNHNTVHGQKAEEFVKDYCSERKIKLITGKILTDKESHQSWEEYWRVERYNFLNQFQNHVIATAHHLDDAIETYIFGCAHGKPKYINYRYNNVVRPFLLSRKVDLIGWCVRHKVSYLTDPSNSDPSYTRNQIRLNVIPELLKVNPGLAKTVKKMYCLRLIEVETTLSV